MSSRITALSLVSRDPHRLGEFWSAVLGWPEIFRDDNGIDLRDPSTGTTLEIGLTTEPGEGKDRLHLDLRADGTTTAEELDRLLALGAEKVDVGQPADATWVVLADPDGNTFCLLSRTVHEIEALT